MSEWSEQIKAFWMGTTDSEYIAWKGSNQVFVFKCKNYPKPPDNIINYGSRIETLEDFNDAIMNGLMMTATYTESGTDAFGNK